MNRDVLLLAGLALVVIMVILAFLDDMERLLRVPVRRLRLGASAYLTRTTLVPAGIAIFLAVVYPGVAVKLYLLLVGAVVARYAYRKQTEEEREIPIREIAQLVLAFRGTYQLQPSVFSSLAEVSKKLTQPLQGLIDMLAKTYYLTSSEERAYKEFRLRTDNVYLNQFIYILEMSETAHPEAVVAALDGFAARLRRHVELRRQVDTSLGPITSQVSFLQGLSIVIVIAVGLIPTLRQAYSSPIGQVFFMIVASGAIGTSYYIERRMRSLKERIM